MLKNIIECCIKIWNTEDCVHFPERNKSGITGKNIYCKFITGIGCIHEAGKGSKRVQLVRNWET